MRPAWLCSVMALGNCLDAFAFAPIRRAAARCGGHSPRLSGRLNALAGAPSLLLLQLFNSLLQGLHHAPEHHVELLVVERHSLPSRFLVLQTLSPRKVACGR